MNPDQSGFVSNRTLGDNIRMTLNIIENSLKTKQQMLISMLDAEKAFDQVSWSFKFEVCQKFESYHQFISWLKTIYNTPRSRIQVNSIISFSGTRQGDPLPHKFHYGYRTWNLQRA